MMGVLTGILIFALGFITGYVCKKDPRSKDGKFKKKKWWQL